MCLDYFALNAEIDDAVHKSSHWLDLGIERRNAVILGVVQQFCDVDELIHQLYVEECKVMYKLY